MKYAVRVIDYYPLKKDACDLAGDSNFFADRNAARS